MSHDVVATPRRSNIFIRIVEKFLFNVRWGLIPFYVGLIPVLFFYGVANFHEMWAFISSEKELTIETVKVFALDSIDIVMIANLIIMIISGSYNSFVSKDHGYVNANISSGQLKVKIATSVTILSMIYLLKVFVTVEMITWDTLLKQLTIYGAFLITSLLLAGIEFMHSKEQHS